MGIIVIIAIAIFVINRYMNWRRHVDIMQSIIKYGSDMVFITAQGNYRAGNMSKSHYEQACRVIDGYDNGRF